MSDRDAGRVREARKAWDWKPAELARRCAELDGRKWTENTIENIEGGRRRGGSQRRAITVDELYTLARALEVPVSELLLLGAGAGYGPMTEAGLRRYAAQINKAADALKASGITWGDDIDGEHHEAP